MKNRFRILLTTVAVSLSFTIMAQDIEIIPYASWQFGGKLALRYGEAKFRPSENYGAALNVIMPTGTALQLEYFQQPTTIEYNQYYPSVDFEQYKTIIHWYQIGGIKQQDFNDRFAAFGGLGLGASNILVDIPDPTTSNVNSWAFSITGQVGAKIYLSDRIGLRLHARLLMPIQWGGFGFYFGSGGSGTSVNVGSYFLQGDLGGGLIIRL